MKWNWGTKLVLAMAAFMIMVIVFVVLMMRENIALVEKDYYPKGQEYQDLLDKKRNAASIGEVIQLQKTANGTLVVFPEQFNHKELTGQVYFYHRIDDQFDKVFELSDADSAGFLLPTGNMSGRYIAKIDWQLNGTAYYVEKTIEYP